MRPRIRPRRPAVLLLAALAACAWAGTSAAQEKTKSTQTEADWVAYDPAASTIEVKVRKPGRGPDARKLKRNKTAVFAVKAEGSVLTRTTVSINGLKAELGDLPEGKRVNIYWRVQDDGTFFARKIDAIMSEEEFDAKYGTETE